MLRDIEMIKRKNKIRYKYPLFRKVDYKDYYNYLDKIQDDEIKEMINYYDGKGQTIITGIISAIIISVILGMYRLIYTRIQDIYNPQNNILPKDAQILANGLIMTSVVITIILLGITVILYKNYKNKRYEINIAKEYLSDKEKSNGKS